MKLPRPPTAPDVRFGIRRFKPSLRHGASDVTMKQAPADQSISWETFRSCAMPQSSTMTHAHYRLISTIARLRVLAASAGQHGSSFVSIAATTFGAAFF